MLATYQKCRHEKINMDMEKGKPVVSKGGGCCVYSVCVWGGGYMWRPENPLASIPQY